MLLNRFYFDLIIQIDINYFVLHLRVVDSIPDNDVMGVKISSSSFRQPRPKLCIAQSLPMAVPIFSQRPDDDYEEVN